MTLHVSHLGKRFADSRGVAREALRGIDLRVNANEFVSLVGASGCGKSTLLRIVGGLETASEGHVRLDGRAVGGPTPDVAMVFQEPRLMPWLTVRENARLALLGRPLAEQNARIDDALVKVGLAAFADALPRQLSGGMAQRAALARALVRNPSVLLLDEPFAALDSFMRARLQDHLRELHARENLTVLFVTHDAEEAIVLSDRIAVMAGPPGLIVREFAVDLPRPRRRGDAEVQRLKEEIVGAIEASGAKLTA